MNGGWTEGPRRDPLTAVRSRSWGDEKLRLSNKVELNNGQVGGYFSVFLKIGFFNIGSSPKGQAGVKGGCSLHHAQSPTPA